MSWFADDEGAADVMIAVLLNLKILLQADGESLLLLMASADKISMASLSTHSTSHA